MIFSSPPQLGQCSREPNDRGFGMLGSGMFVINPPHTLLPALREALPVLVRLLGQYAGAGHRLEWAGS